MYLPMEETHYEYLNIGAKLRKQKVILLVVLGENFLMPI